jgi:hypothetical protein
LDGHWVFHFLKGEDQMINNDLVNVGSIDDVPIGRGMWYTVKNHHLAIFRETYGHFYIFEDARSDAARGLHHGRIEDGKVCLPNGHAVDLRTGQLDQSSRFLHTVLTWVENGFVFFSLSGLMLA